MRRLKAVNNPRINAVSRLAYGIARGSKRFYALPKAERAAIRAAARRLHEQEVEFSRAAERVESATEGFVYVISHPAFPGYVKIGCAVDVESRLRSFQTGCPHRQYRAVYSVYVKDRRRVEAAIHASLSDRRAAGEWFRMPEHTAIYAVSNVSAIANITEE